MTKSNESCQVVKVVVGIYGNCEVFIYTILSSGNSTMVSSAM